LAKFERQCVLFFGNGWAARLGCKSGYAGKEFRKLLQGERHPEIREASQKPLCVFARFNYRLNYPNQVASV
jgi:hypothetical protein